MSRFFIPCVGYVIVWKFDAHINISPPQRIIVDGELIILVNTNMAEWQIEGQNVLITGAASGIGAANVEVFLKNGAEKVAILDIAEDKGKEIAEKLNEIYKDKVIFIKCDVSKEEEVTSAFNQVLEEFKRIDVIINNAGIMNDNPDVRRTAIDVNWSGVVSFTMKGIEHMRKDGGGQGGTIINVSSVAAFIRVTILPIYCGSKAAVLHFGRTISSKEFISDSGVRILTICFGSTDTPLLDGLQHKTFDTKTSSVLLSRIPDLYHQKVESAVNALIKMYREGNAGSIWLSVNDKPGKDVTANFNNAYEQLEILMLPDNIKDISEFFGSKSV